MVQKAVFKGKSQILTFFCPAPMPPFVPEDGPFEIVQWPSRT